MIARCDVIPHRDWVRIELSNGLMFNTPGAYQSSGTPIYIYWLPESTGWDVRIYPAVGQTPDLLPLCELQARLLLSLRYKEALSCVMKMYQDTQAGL